MLTLDGLEITQGAWTLRANWTLATGARCALIGPSGAGKSTLLLTIGGFLEPGRGRVLWQDRNLTGMAPGERPISILFQDQNLFPHLTVEQNLALGVAPNRRLLPEEARQVTAVLARTGLADLGGRKPAQLSGGQQARAALARALLRRRPLLLLDEPFAALGPALKTEMLDLVADVVAETGATLLMVTHDPDDARRICNQTVLVADGTAQAPVPTIGLLDHPPPVLRDYLGQ